MSKTHPEKLTGVPVAAEWDSSNQRWTRFRIATDFTVQQDDTLEDFVRRFHLHGVQNPNLPEKKKSTKKKKSGDGPRPRGDHRFAESVNADKRSASGAIEFSLSFPDCELHGGDCGVSAVEVSMTGRVLACSCTPGDRLEKSGAPQRSAVSATIRLDGDSAKDAAKKLEKWFADRLACFKADGHWEHRSAEVISEFASRAREHWDFHCTVTQESATLDEQQRIAEQEERDERHAINNAFFLSGYRNSSQPSARFPVTINSLSKIIRDSVFLRANAVEDGGETSTEPTPDLDHLHGAVLIAGRTKSAKSVVTRALIHQLFSDVATYRFLRDHHGRKPHLLSCEDPIEARFIKPGDRELPGFIDYTARDYTNQDYRSLSESFQDALRQTPACMLIGEIRDKDDLRSVIEFGGTGHLVVATLHAGSLNDTFAKIFEATDVKTSADRGLVGSRLLSVIHLKQLVFGTNGKADHQVVLPALWRRSAGSTAALVASGIGSLTPSRSPKQDCLGRQYFADVLVGSSVGNEDLTPLLEVARRHDLRGE